MATYGARACLLVDGTHLVQIALDAYPTVRITKEIL